MSLEGERTDCGKTLAQNRLYFSLDTEILEVGLIDLLIVSVGAARGREKLRAMGEAQDRGHGPLLHFNQLNPPPKF